MSLADYLVIAAYFAAVTFIGFLAGRGQKSGLSYFLADRSVHWLAAAITMTAVSVSTITFIGMPGQAFKSDWTFLQIYMAIPVASLIVMFLFLPSYNRLGVTTAYEYLEHRFDVRTRLFAAAMFQIIACGSTGVVIYAPAIVFSETTGFSVPVSILVVGTLTMLYTMLGGVRGVIYTDILQALVFLAGWLVALLFVIRSLPGGVGEIVSAAATCQKFRTFDFSIDPRIPVTFWGGMIGMLFTHVALSGVNQAQVQKYLTVSNMAGGRLAILAHGVILLGVYVAFFFLGTSLFVFYQARPGSLPADINPDRVFPFFIMKELPPGLRGFLIAGAFAAAMSTISSALNTLANVTEVDFLDRFRAGNTIARAKILTICWGLVVIGAGLLAWRLGSILELIVKVNSYCYGCLLGVFLLGMITRRGTGQGARAGLVAGIGTVVLLAWFQPGLWIWFGAVGCAMCMLIGWWFSELRPAPAKRSRD